LRIFAVSAGVNVSVTGASVEDIGVLLSCNTGCPENAVGLARLRSRNSTARRYQRDE